MTKGEEGGKGQTKDDGPSQRPPEDDIVSSNINIRIPIGDECEEINVETSSQWD